LSCEAVQEQLIERAFAHAAVDDPQLAALPEALRAHLAGCEACRGHLRFVRALAASLASDPAPPPRPVVMARTRARAIRALRAQRPARGAVRPLVGALAVSLLALPVAVGHAWLVAEGASLLLGPWLPHALLAWLGIVYFGSIALALGALYALVPLWVALARHSRAEATA
jgi:hypothetical protein